ncbi:hypothetical protein T492DRAFT_853060, partial [Pavlovales sp. CCMP2436]
MFACSPGARSVAVHHLPSASLCGAHPSFDADVVCAAVCEFGPADGARVRALASTADGRLFRWDPTLPAGSE